MRVNLSQKAIVSEQLYPDFYFVIVQPDLIELPLFWLAVLRKAR